MKGSECQSSGFSVPPESRGKNQTTMVVQLTERLVDFVHPITV